MRTTRLPVTLMASTTFAREWAYLAHCVIGDSAAVLGFVCPSRVMGEDPFWEDIVGAF